MIKICKDCGKEFETEQPKKQLCDDCIKKHIKVAREKVKSVYRTKNNLPKPKPKNHKPVFTIDDIIRFQENYYRSHKVSISYTEAVAMLERG